MNRTCFFLDKINAREQLASVYKLHFPSVADGRLLEESNSCKTPVAGYLTFEISKPKKNIRSPNAGMHGSSSIIKNTSHACFVYAVDIF